MAIYTEYGRYLKAKSFKEYLESTSHGGVEIAMCYCWYIWEKGFVGEPTIRWIDPAKMH